MKKLILGKLYHWQEDAINYIRNSYGTGKLLFIKSLRQNSGKTFTLMNALICCAYDKPGCKSLVIEPVNNQNDRVFNDLCRACKPIIKSSNKSTKEIIFDNDSIIYLRSAEAGDSIRGITVTGICCVDEACYINDNFINTMLPVISKFKPPCIFASSPALTNGFFYENYIKGLSGNDERIVSFNWSAYIDEMYTPEDLEFYRRTYSKRKFTTEILGEFITEDGSLFTGLENSVLDYEPNKDVLYFGIDWGSGSGKDNTAITCLNNKGEMVFIKYFNDKSPVEQINIIADLINKWEPIKVTVESNSIGKVYYDLLRRSTKVPINLFTTTNDSKNKIIDKLQVALENGLIKLQRDNELLTELRVYKPEVTKSGKITYNAPIGYKDDTIIATAICYDSLSSTKGNYTISF